MEETEDGSNRYKSRMKPSLVSTLYKWYGCCSWASRFGDIDEESLLNCKRQPQPMEIAFSDDGKLGASITRLLSDKLYEKRKSGALQIEAIVRDLMRGAGVLSTASTGVGGGHNNTASLNNNQNSSNTSHQRIESLISVLTTDFTYSIVPNSRNGGLIGLAATAIALGPQIHLHLSTLVPPILSCFQDHDSRVRYYACESMYNIAKVARSQILLYFNEIFDALTKLSVDVELSVKNGAELLDRLIKDIVSEKSTFYISAATTASSAGTTTIDNVSSSTPTAASTGQSMPSVPGTVPVHGGPLTFNLPRFIPLLIERINVISAPSRLFLIQWIFVLHSVPDLELVSYLAEFLHGLLAYLSDPSVDVRTATLNVLGDFLREIGNVVQVQKQIGVVDVAALTASAIVEGQAAGEGETELSASNVKSSTPYTLGQSVTLDFGKMTLTLAQYLSTSADQETQAVCLKWINSFLGMAPSGVAMLPHTPLLLASILPILSHSVPTIRSLAIDVNSNLFSLVIEAGSSSKKEADSSSIKTADTASVGGGVGGGTSSSPSYNPFDIYTTVTTLMTQCLSPAAEETRLGSLEWLRMLHKKFPAQVLDADSGLFQTLLSALTDFSEEVVRCDLQLLAQISHSSDDSYFSKFMANLLALFSGDRRLLETRGGLIIRQLCLYLNPERMYRNFGEILEQESVWSLQFYALKSDDHDFLGFGICFNNDSNPQLDYDYCA